MLLETGLALMLRKFLSGDSSKTIYTVSGTVKLSPKYFINAFILA